MKELIKKLNENEKKFQYDTVEEIRKNKGKINKFLLTEIKNTIKEIKKDNEYDIPMSFLYSIYLLSEFKDKEAFPTIIELFSIENINYFDVFGDALVDRGYKYIISCFNGDFSLIDGIINNKKIDPIIKDNCLESYVYFLNNKMISKEELIDKIKNWIKIYEKCEDYKTLTFIADNIINAHLIELVDKVKELYDKDLINEQMIGGYDDFLDYVFNFEYKFEIPLPIEDAVEEMPWWACFKDNKKKRQLSTKKINKELVKGIASLTQNTKAKIGRNDLCPCGSGKKYKKCCLEKTEKKIILPYQEYILKSYHYPNGKEFYNAYNPKYIEIDKEMYKVCHNKTIPIFIKRDYLKENLIDLEYCKNTTEIMKKNIKDIKTLKKYNEIASIHYNIEEFIYRYAEILYNLKDKIDVSNEIEYMNNTLGEIFSDFKKVE